MAEVAGYGGNVYFDASLSQAAGSITSAVGGVNNWVINYKADLYETTDFADAGTRTYLGGMKDWGGTFNAYYSTTVSYSSALAPGTSLSMKFKLNASHQIHGNVVLTGWSFTTAVDGVETVNFTFQGTGAPTYA